MAQIRLYNMLRAKVGEKEAEAFMETLDQKVDERVEMMKEGLATKKDLFEGLASVRKEMSKDISDVRADLTKLIYQANLTQLVAIIVSVITLVLLLKK